MTDGRLSEFVVCGDAIGEPCLIHTCGSQPNLGVLDDKLSTLVQVALKHLETCHD